MVVKGGVRTAIFVDFVFQFNCEDSLFPRFKIVFQLEYDAKNPVFIEILPYLQNFPDTDVKGGRMESSNRRKNQLNIDA